VNLIPRYERIEKLLERGKVAMRNELHARDRDESKKKINKQAAQTQTLYNPQRTFMCHAYLTFKPFATSDPEWGGVFRRLTVAG
jgi:hypothetical protein